MLHEDIYSERCLKNAATRTYCHTVLTNGAGHCQADLVERRIKVHPGGQTRVWSRGHEPTPLLDAGHLVRIVGLVVST